jgi:hypothetical protein
LERRGRKETHGEVGVEGVDSEKELVVRNSEDPDPK